MKVGHIGFKANRLRGESIYKKISIEKSTILCITIKLENIRLGNFHNKNIGNSKESAASHNNPTVKMKNVRSKTQEINCNSKKNFIITHL